MARNADSNLFGLPSVPGENPWPNSPWTLVARARESKGEDKKLAIDSLITMYYKPVYRFFQRVLGIQGDRLRDVTQEFFARFIEKDFLKSVTEEKSFRNFLKVACRRHYINWWQAEQTRKRIEADAESPMTEDATSKLMDEELRSWYLQEAVRIVKDELLKGRKEHYFRVFEARVRFDGEKPAEYAAIAKELGLGVFDVRNYLTHARKIFREALVQLARERAPDHKRELADLNLLQFVE